MKKQSRANQACLLKTRYHFSKASPCDVVFEPNSSNITQFKSACQEDIEPFGKKIRKVQQPRKLSRNLVGRPRQEHQVGRLLSIFEERLARRAYLRTHGQPTR